jgi:hypothetical protein
MIDIADIAIASSRSEQCLFVTEIARGVDPTKGPGYINSSMKLAKAVSSNHWLHLDETHLFGKKRHAFEAMISQLYLIFLKRRIVR